MRLSLELKALITYPRRCGSDGAVAKIMARILSKYAVSSCLQVIHSADARSFDEVQHRRMSICCASYDVGWLTQILPWMTRGADPEQARCAEAQSGNRRSLNYSSASDGAV